MNETLRNPIIRDFYNTLLEMGPEAHGLECEITTEARGALSGFIEVGHGYQDQIRFSIITEDEHKQFRSCSVHKNSGVYDLYPQIRQWWIGKGRMPTTKICHTCDEAKETSDFAVAGQLSVIVNVCRACVRLKGDITSARKSVEKFENAIRKEIHRRRGREVEVTIKFK